MAQIIFTGNTGKDAELKFVASGRAVLNFSVADSKSKKLESGEWEKLAEQWFNVAVWGELAEFYAEKLPKGSRVTVYGEFYERKYTTKDGVDGSSLDVVAKGIDIFPPKNGGQQAQRSQQAQQNDPWGGQQQAAAGTGQSNAGGGWGNGPDSSPPF